MKTLLKPLSLALFVAATLPTQSAYIRTSPPFDTIPATSPSLYFCKAIGGKNDDRGKSLIQTSDGGYAITGYTKSFGAGKTDVYVVKLDANNNLQWTKTIGGPDDEGFSIIYIFADIIQTADGGYAIASFTESFGAAEWDVYFVKLDRNGHACCAVSQTPQVGSGGRLGSTTSSIGSGGTLTAPNPHNQLRRHPL